MKSKQITKEKNTSTVLQQNILIFILGFCNSNILPNKGKFNRKFKTMNECEFIKYFLSFHKKI